MATKDCCDRVGHASGIEWTRIRKTSRVGVKLSLLQVGCEPRARRGDLSPRCLPRPRPAARPAGFLARCALASCTDKMDGVFDRNQEATCYVGDLDSQVDEALLWELCVQVGPVVNVHVPKDKLTQMHMGFGFVEFKGQQDAEYAIKVLNMIKLHGKPIRVNAASKDNEIMDVGANIFVGNLDPEVDEKLLYDTFSAFGTIVTTPKIMRDPNTGNSRGFGFVSFDSFEASDAAIESMNGQFLCNRPISCTYAIKKDSKGERHGSAAERLLAANNPLRKLAAGARPNQFFASVPSVGGAQASTGILPPPPPPGALPPPPPGMAP
eukprot:scaffold241934_cov24-Tisochrysis_lutea.AAC.1